VLKTGANRSPLLLMAIAITALVWFLIFFRNTPLLVDEHENFRQITNFTNFHFKLLEISAMPGYHVVIASVLKATGANSIYAIRIINALIGLLSVWIFFLLVNKLDKTNRFQKSLHYLFFPILFMFFILMYTDVLSLLLVMATLLYTIDRRYVLAGLFGIASMLIRQNNVIWNAFFLALIYIEHFGWTLNWNNCKAILKKAWPFFAGFVLFTLFVIINKGVAIGDASRHPAFKLSSGNLFYFLYCSLILFLPLHIANLPAIYKLVTRRIWVVPVSIFLIFWLTFRNDHPYNLIEEHYFFRNLVLTQIFSNVKLWFIFFFGCLFALLSFSVTPFLNKNHYLLYPFTILFLVPSWLIEQRYYLIPMILFLAFRKTENKYLEIALLAWFWLILFFLLPLVASVRMFP
jgi:alpha-1,2-glucosyltransferase